MTIRASRTRHRLLTAPGPLAALTALAAVAAVLPAASASANMTPCGRVYDTPTRWHLQCGRVYLTHSVAGTDPAPPPAPGPDTLVLTVVLNGTGVPAQVLDRVGDDLLVTVEQLGAAAATQDPGQATALRDAALAAAADAAGVLGQRALPLAGIADDPRPHPWLQQVAGDWTTAVGLLERTPGGQDPAGDDQQAAALLQDAYQLIISGA